MSFNEFLFTLFDLCIRLHTNIKFFINDRIQTHKSSYFEEYYVSLGVFNTITNTYYSIYNYESFWAYIFLLFKSLFIEKNEILVPINFGEVHNNLYIIGAFYKDQTLYHVIGDINIEQSPSFNLIYATIDDNIDITHPLENFKLNLFNNKMTCKQLLTIIMCYYGIKYIPTNDSILKFVPDDNFEELVFKGKDILKVHNG